MVVVPRNGRPVARIAEVAFGDDPKGPDRRERPTVVPVELVGVITVVQHDLALEAARQVEAFRERVSWIPIAVSVTALLARVVVPSWVVDVAAVTRVVVTITWIEAVEHALLPSWKPIDTVQQKPLRGVGPADVRVGPLRTDGASTRRSE